jgi:hypothetical protein
VSKRLTLEEAFTPSPASSLLEEANANTLQQREKIQQAKEIINHASNQAIKQSIGIARKEITIRLQQENWDRLERAAMNRKLARTEPYSKQDIMEAALVDWLARNGG